MDEMIGSARIQKTSESRLNSLPTPRNNELGDRLRELYAWCAEVKREWLRPWVDSMEPEVAQGLLELMAAVIDGMGIQSLVKREGFELERALRGFKSTLEICFRSLRACPNGEPPRRCNSRSRKPCVAIPRPGARAAALDRRQPRPAHDGERGPGRGGQGAPTAARRPDREDNRRLTCTIEAAMTRQQTRTPETRARRAGLAVLAA